MSSRWVNACLSSPRSGTRPPTSSASPAPWPHRRARLTGGCWSTTIPPTTPTSWRSARGGVRLHHAAQGPRPSATSRPSRPARIRGCPAHLQLRPLRRSIGRSFTHISKLDGDMELPPDYFERILARVRRRTRRLGMAGGLRRELVRGRWWVEQVPLEHHVNGALKCYSRECFEAIGGVQEQARLGHDRRDPRPDARFPHQDLRGLGRHSPPTLGERRRHAPGPGTLRGCRLHRAFPGVLGGAALAEDGRHPDRRGSPAWRSSTATSVLRCAGPRSSKTMSSGWRSAVRLAVGLPASSRCHPAPAPVSPRAPRPADVRDRRPGASRGRPRRGGPDREYVRGPGTSRAGFARPARVRSRRSGDPTAPGHRSGDRRSADLQRGRLDRSDPQRGDLQLRGAPRGAPRSRS